MSARRPRRLLAAGLTAAGLLVAAASPGAAAPSARGAATAETRFARALLPRLAASGNAVYSPSSMAVALAMTDAGARGATARQIARVLGASSPAAAAADAGALRRAMPRAVGSGRSAPTLEVANALWTQRGMALEAPFTHTLTGDFGAAPQQTDFAADPQAALGAINGWVSHHTGGIIPDVLPAGSITAQTRLVLANAIYLKARWATPFEKAQTAPGPFTTAHGTSVRVPFMSVSDAARPYAAGVHWQAVELPYAGSSLSLLAILPRGESLAAFEHTLSAGSLAQITGALDPAQRVDLRIPKLHLHTQTALDAPLEALGMRAAFGSGADFSAITHAARLRIGLVEHAADLRLDEAGTVAAGSTVVVAPTDAQPVPRHPISVDLDHPFLLLLRDDASGAVLFVAQVANPAAG